MSKTDALLRAKIRKAEKLVAARRFEEARGIYATLYRQAPRNAEIGFAYASLSAQLNFFEDAEAAFKALLSWRPEFAEAHFNLARVYQLTGRLPDAADHLRAHVRLRPQDVNGYTLLGPLLMQLGQAELAAQVCRDGLRLAPDSAELYNNLGVIELDLKHYDDALACFEKHLQLASPTAGVLSNLGNVYRALGRLDDAERSYRQALTLDPASTYALGSLGLHCMRQGDIGQAITHYDKALAIEPGLAGIRWNRAHALLLTGRFQEGWRDYEARFHAAEAMRQFGRRRFAMPRWDGSANRDKTLLVYAEQGFGDTLQFCRYLAAARQRVGRLVFECPAELHGVLQGVTGVDAWLTPAQANETAADVDLHVPLLSLPGLFHTDFDHLPADVPYLNADPPRVTQWAGRMTAGALNVGLVWAGRATNINDPRRSLALSALAPLGQVSGVCFYSLQKGPAAAEAEQAPPGMHMINLDAQIADFADTAAIMAHLDLVITVDTAAAHLAGALARPVWTLIYHPPDWRWFLDWQDSPWYPTMRLFRQSVPGDWAPVIGQVAAALQDMADQRSAG